MPKSHVHLKPAVEQFLDAISQADITPPTTIVGDGELHRFSSNGKPGDDAGWYVFHGDEFPSGAFGDFRTGLNVKSWVAQADRTLSPSENREFKQKRLQIQVEKKVKKERLQVQAQQTATRLLRVAAPANGSHPYLIRKGIKPFDIYQWDDPKVTVRFAKKTGKPFLNITSECRQAEVGFGMELGEESVEEICQNWRNILIIPMRDEVGVIQSLQLIARDGQKKFLYGGKAHGSYHLLGSVPDSDKVLIAEGFATTATIHELTGLPVVAAFNAGNLSAVAQSIRSQKPDAALYLCADDDLSTKGNPGITKGVQAAYVVDGTLLVPWFGVDRPEGATDFNDMAAHLGKEAVTRFFYQVLFGEENEDPNLDRLQTRSLPS